MIASDAPDCRIVGAFGGTAVHEVALRSDTGLEARILTWGAVIRALSLPLAGGGRLPLVLGFEGFDPYPRHSPYFGAVVGRFANRIAGGRFTLDGQEHRLDRNEGGTTTLHGGAGGFSARVWQIADRSACQVTLGLVSADGDQGFPGRLRVSCTYTLGPGNRLEFAVSARTDRATPVSLAQHSYFNLDGSPDLDGHLLCVHADAYTPVRPDLIPSGEIRLVQDTGLDFRHPRRLRDAGLALDHNFVLRDPPDPGERLRPAADLASVRSGVRLRVSTTKPGVQIYDGHKISVPVPGLGGRRYGANAGLCIETQHFPDSPNQPAFPDAILRPGETYAHRTVYAFDVPAR